MLDSAAFPPVIEEEEAVCSAISDFFKLHGFNLYFLPPKNKYRLWVCGGQDERHLSPNRGVVKKKIISALCNFSHYHDSWEILIQFWEPTTVRGRSCLTTLDQPFGLSNYDEGLCTYRTHSMSYTIYMDGEKSDEELGLVGRVFQNKLPEFTPDVRYYSSKEYPWRDFAVHCDVMGSSAVPIFELSPGRSCVGVLELVSTLGDTYLEICQAYTAIQVAGLRSSNYCQISLHNLGRQEDAEVEINEVLKEVYETHELPFAQAWAPYQHNSGVDNYENNCNCFGLSCNEEVMARIGVGYHGTSVTGDFQDFQDFQDACQVNCLRKGQGLVGKTLLFHKPCFCRDIAQLSITEYPLVPYARMCKLKGCFAVCLLSTSTRNIDYVLELFLPPSITENNGDPETLLGPVFATMKQHFRSFTVVTGAPGDRLSVEVIESSANDELGSSFKVCQVTNSCPRPEALQTEREAVEEDSSRQQSPVDMEDDIHDRRDVGGAEQSNIAITCKTKTSNRARKYKISYKEIKERQDSGVKIDDAAGSLGVGRSTLKRICREFGLEDWRASRTRKKVNHPLSNLKRASGSVQAGDEQTSNSSRRDPSCSEPPPKLTLPNVTPKKDVGTVTIKAKYKDITIKFQLSFSCGMAELVENITERLELLKERAFSIKYLDDEDDWILIACDKDLHECMVTPTSLPIRMLTDQPINDEAL